MKIRITLTEEMLGTASGNPEVHSEFIASKSADADRIKEELEALHAEERMEKSMTVFPRTEDGRPMLWDYQIKGFIKEALGVLMDFVEADRKIGKAKLSRWTHKKIVDNAVFVSPRKIPLEFDGEVGICTRPLRAETMRGERIALASSETVPAGTSFEVDIVTLHQGLNDLIESCLDYGANKGIGQWRNNGKGRFRWERVFQE